MTDPNQDSGTSPPKRPDPVKGRSSVAGIVDAILAIGSQRKALLAHLRVALESGQEREALILSRRLCGLDYEQSDRTHSGIN